MASSIKLLAGFKFDEEKKKKPRKTDSVLDGAGTLPRHESEESKRTALDEHEHFDPEKSEMSKEIELPTIDIENYDDEPQDTSVESTHGGSLEVAIIGTGQGGSRIAEAFYKLGYTKCIVVNTAVHDLHHIAVPEKQKLHISAQNEGAGKNMDNGRQAAERHSHDIYDLMLKTFGNKVDRVLVCAGAGGGTGGGSCAALVELSKKYLAYIGASEPNKRVGAIVALPQAGECTSPNVSENAINVVKTMTALADESALAPLIIMDNDKIKKLYPRLTVKEFWPTVNNTIASLYHTFNLISTHSSAYTTFDPADYESLLSMSGCMIMGCTTVKDPTSPDEISKSIKGNLERNLLAGGFDLNTAKGVGALVVGGAEIFANVQGLMDAIETGFDTISNVVGKALVHRGIYEVPGNSLRVYTMITGLAKPTSRINELSRFSASRS